MTDFRVRRTWPTAYEALTYAGDRVAQRAREEDARHCYDIAAALHLAASALYTEAMHVIGNLSMFEAAREAVLLAKTAGGGR